LLLLDSYRSVNAAMESFLSLLQKIVLDTRRWETRKELRLAIVIWIETKYNRRRRRTSNATLRCQGRAIPR
jgi:transposase InsO family protein